MSEVALVDRPLCRVSPTWGTWEGGQQLSVCVTSPRLPHPSPLAFLVGAAFCLAALALACWRVRFP